MRRRLGTPDQGSRAAVTGERLLKVGVTAGVGSMEGPPAGVDLRTDSEES